MNKFIAFGLLLVSPISLLAEETKPQETIPAPVNELDMLQVVTPLLLVIVLIFFLAWLVKKINPAMPKMGKDIELISSTPLSSQSKLSLIRVGGKDILIGITSNSISHLHTFDEPVVPDREEQNPVDFARQFKSLLSRSKEP